MGEPFSGQLHLGSKCPVTSERISLSYPITGDGAGQACDRIYITDAKLAKCGYTPHVGDEVNVTYNKFGKVAAILPVGE